MALISFVDSTKKARLTHFFLNRKTTENSDYPRSFEKSLK